MGSRWQRTPLFCPTSASGSTCGQEKRLLKQGHSQSSASLQQLYIRRTPTSVDPSDMHPNSSAFATIKETGLKSFHGYLKQIDGMLAGREWFSDRYSVLDPYGLVFYTWGVRRELPMGELKNYTAFKDRMLKRSAVGRVVEDEKIKV